MSGPPAYMKPEEIVRELSSMADEFVDEIVGGEECAGEDTRRTHRAEVCARAADIIFEWCDACEGEGWHMEHWRGPEDGAEYSRATNRPCMWCDGKGCFEVECEPAEEGWE